MATALAGREIVNRNGVSISSIPDLARNADALENEIGEFNPDWVLVSSEDLSHTLLRESSRCAGERLIYLAHTPQFFPFGPESWSPDPRATALIRNARAVVAIGEHMSGYIRQYAGCDATVIHPPIYGMPPYLQFGNAREGWILMINPCAAKGIDIFLALAEKFPALPFAALVGWGTTSADRARLERIANITVLQNVPRIDDVLRGTRVLLMPSIWYEGFGLIAMEAMLRGLPVISSNSGGLMEAKRGTGYIIPVHPFERYEPAFDEAHMPIPVPVAQDIEPWVKALHTLTSDHAEYERESHRSREAGLRFVSPLRAADFEDFLLRLSPFERAPASPAQAPLSSARQALLLKRLRERR